MVGNGFVDRLSKIIEQVGGRTKAAEIMGISRQQLHRYLVGDVVPSLEPLIKLCKTAGVSLDWVVEGKVHLDGDNDSEITIKIHKGEITVTKKH